jgi:hypothetical protein
LSDEIGRDLPDRCVDDGRIDAAVGVSRCVWRVSPRGVLGLGLVGSERDGGNPLETGAAVVLAAIVAGVLGGLVFALDLGFRTLQRTARGS